MLEGASIRGHKTEIGGVGEDLRKCGIKEWFLGIGSNEARCRGKLRFEPGSSAEEDDEKTDMIYWCTEKKIKLNEPY